MVTDRLKQVSLRKFRDEIADLREVVEVSRRDPATGSIQLLGFWTPHMTHPPDAKPLPATVVGTGKVEPVALDISFEDDDGRPKVIKTPEQARAASAAAIATVARPITPVPKPGKKR